MAALVSLLPFWLAILSARNTKESQAAIEEAGRVLGVSSVARDVRGPDGITQPCSAMTDDEVDAVAVRRVA